MTFLDRWYRRVRWWLRGVQQRDHRVTCARCGRLGQDHWAWKGCLRFSDAGQTTWTWCPGCGDDLVSQVDALVDVVGPHDFVWYRCRCGQHSVWDFGAPAPILLQRGPWLEVVRANHE